VGILKGEPVKPLRSLLFVPGHRGPWAEKAISAGVDGLILDLEDSVPENLKSEARAEVARSIARIHGSGSRVGVYVRVNALDTGLSGDDIEAVLVPGIDGLSLPKTFGPDDVVRFDALVTHFERKNGLEPGSVELILNLETAEAYASCEGMAVASPRVATLFAGTARDADVSRSIGFQFTPEGQETLYLRSRAVLAARAAGLDFPLVGVWQDLADPEGARRFAVQNRQLGFRGQVLIHPSHVGLANEVFSPSKFEVDFYAGMIAAFQEAEARGAAAVVYEGMHVDYAHIKTAREVLAYSRELEQQDNRASQGDLASTS
jgi:citrate lyase subunit beta/citryl-CoA lyase